MTTDTRLHHARTFLQTAVTLEILALQRRGPLVDWELERAQNTLREALQHGGDTFQFGGGKRGEAGAYAAALAQAVAILSLQPGGITIFGDHYEAHYSDDWHVQYDETVLVPDESTEE